MQSTWQNAGGQLTHGASAPTTGAFGTERVTVSKSAQVAMVGAFATRQGNHPGVTAWELGVQAYIGALRQSGIRREAIDGLVTQMSQDGSSQMEPSRFGQIIGLNPKASGALHYGGGGFSLAYASALITSGQCRLVACVYATNQRTSGYRFATAKDPYTSPYGFLNAAGFAALGFQRYLHKYGRQADLDKLGAIALNQRSNAASNPIAFRREPMSWDDYLHDRWIVWPLRRSDVCLITDGGVCVLLASADLARDLVEQPVYLRSWGRQDSLRMMENEDHLLIPHMKSVATQVRERGGIHPEDVNALYVQDAHSPAILLTLENYGFCGEGEALDFIQDGRISVQGSLPVNSSGGQLSEGYMLGWLHHVELFHQLRGECGERQIPDCAIAQFCGTGGFREFACAAVYSNQPD